MTSFVKKYPVLSFLILNYAISWSFLYPSYQMILKNEGITPLSLIGLIGAYGPSISAIIIQSIIDKQNANSLLRTLVKLKAKVSLYAIIAILPILCYVFSQFLSTLIFGEISTFELYNGITSIPIWLLLALPFGPMGEELGWRGFLLPKLLQKYSIVQSTVFVGLAWGLWHVASFTFPGAAIPEFIPVSIWSILLFFVYTTALSFVFTYVHLQSNGSVFLAILLHAFFNAASNVAIEFLGKEENFNLQLSAYILNIIIVGVIGFLMVRRHAASYQQSFSERPNSK